MVILKVCRYAGRQFLALASGALFVMSSCILSPVQAFAATGQEVLNQTQSTGVPYVQGEQSLKWPSIISQSAVVMDMNTGTIVYGKNPLAAHYPASITKIMTALLALEHGHLNDVLTASANAVQQPPDKLYMVPGEQEELEPLLYGLLLDSANDAAVEIAEHYGGSVSNFAKMMNAKAKSLGLTHTNFVNPNGLPNAKHQTTAYDMAVISRAAMQNAEFRKIVGTKDYSWNGEKWHAKLSNLNEMLFYYPGCIGLKTGFTDSAHETLVVAATHGATTYLAVLMDTPTDQEIRQDASQLLNFAFAHYQTQTLISRGQVVGYTPGDSHVPIVASEPVLATVLKGRPLSFHTNIAYELPAHAVAARAPVGKLVLQAPSGSLITSISVDSEEAWKPDPENNSLSLRDVFAPLAVFVTITLIIVRGLARKRRRKRVRTMVEPRILSSSLDGSR